MDTGAELLWEPPAGIMVRCSPPRSKVGGGGLTWTNMCVGEMKVRRGLDRECWSDQRVSQAGSIYWAPLGCSLCWVQTGVWSGGKEKQMEEESLLFRRIRPILENQQIWELSRGQVWVLETSKCDLGAKTFGNLIAQSTQIGQLRVGCVKGSTQGENDSTHNLTVGRGLQITDYLALNTLLKDWYFQCSCRCIQNR